MVTTIVASYKFNAHKVMCEVKILFKQQFGYQTIYIYISGWRRILRYFGGKVLNSLSP